MISKNLVFQHEILRKEHWSNIIPKIIQVLKINCSLIGKKGRIIIPPVIDKYGGNFLTNQKYDKHSLLLQDNFLSKFSLRSGILENCCDFQLYYFAIPINFFEEIAGYFLVGPIIMNKRKSNDFYVSVSKTSNLDYEEIQNDLMGVRVVSNLMLDSIQNFLRNIIESNVEVCIKGLKQKHLCKEFLDISLEMADAESGSLMLVDSDDVLKVVLVSGRNKDIEGSKVSVGQGVAGISAEKRKSLFIHGQTAGRDVRPYLNQPDILDSFTVPLSSGERVLGVLNVQSRNPKNRIKKKLPHIEQLSRLLSASL